MKWITSGSSLKQCLGGILLGLALLLAGWARGDDGIKVEVTGRVYLKQGRTEDYQIVINGKRTYDLLTLSQEVRKPLSDLMLTAAWRDHSTWDNAKVTVKGSLDESNVIVVDSVTISGVAPPPVTKVNGKTKTVTIQGRLYMGNDELGISKDGKSWRLGFPKDGSGKVVAELLFNEVGKDVTLRGEYGMRGTEEVFLVHPMQPGLRPR